MSPRQEVDMWHMSISLSCSSEEDIVHYVQYKKSKELPKCTGLYLLDKLIEYLSDNSNVLRTSITVAINYYFFLKNIFW